MALSAPGESLLEPARAVLSALEEFERTAVGIRRGVSGTLRLGTIGATDDVLSRLLARVGEELPELSVALETGKVEDNLRRVRDGELDAALVWHADAITGTRALEIKLVPLLATMAPQHPLALRAGHDGRIDLREMRDFPLVLLREEIDPMVHRTVLGWCNAAGFEPELVHHDSVHTILASVAADPRLWTLMPDWPDRRLVQLPFLQEEVAGSIRLITRTTHVSPAARSFVRAVEALALDL